MTSELLKRLGDAFARHVKSLYLVGGSVRDRILGRRNEDIDLATDAVPKETKSILGETKPDGIFNIGEKFGTIGAIYGETRVEITTFRSEKYIPKSRKPDVSFGTNIHDDLSRRDFTINAIAENLHTGEIIDPFGGMQDIDLKLIRAVGNPDERFDEDPLRLLRAIRFSAHLEFIIEPITREAIRRNSSSLQHVSKERIAEEMNKLLVAPSPARAIRDACDLGLMTYIVPELLNARGMDQGEYHFKDVFEHTLIVVDNLPAELDLRWTGLLHDIAKPVTFSLEGGEVHFKGHERVGEIMAREILNRLRLDRKTIATVGKLIRLHTRGNAYSSDWTDGAVRRLIRDVGDDLDSLFALSRADITSRRPAKVIEGLNRVAEFEQRCKDLLEKENVEALSSPLDGNELMTIFNRKPGPWIKPVKDYLLSLVIEGKIGPDDKEEAIHLAEEFLVRTSE